MLDKYKLLYMSSSENKDIIIIIYYYYNGGAPFRFVGDTDWHGMRRLSPVCTRLVPVLLRLSPGMSRFNKVCAVYSWLNYPSLN